MRVTVLKKNLLLTPNVCHHTTIYKSLTERMTKDITFKRVGPVDFDGYTTVNYISTLFCQRTYSYSTKVGWRLVYKFSMLSRRVTVTSQTSFLIVRTILVNRLIRKRYGYLLLFHIFILRHIFREFKSQTNFMYESFTIDNNRIKFNNVRNFNLQIDVWVRSKLQ